MCRRLRGLAGAVVCLLAAAGPAGADGPLPLVAAAKDRRPAEVRALLARGADANARQPDGGTALHWAAHWDDLETAAILIRAGAAVDAITDYGVTPLSLACTNGSAAMVHALLEAGANPNAANPLTGASGLMIASRTGSVAVVTQLLDARAAIDAAEPRQRQTALMWAAAEHHPDVVRLLIARGADVHAGSAGGFTPLLFAAREGDLETAQVLLDAGADVNRAAADGSAPLVVAAVRGHTPLALFLLDHGANANADAAGYTALHWAAGSWDTSLPGVFGRNPQLVDALLAHGANPNVRLRKPPPPIGEVSNARIRFDVTGATPFFLAAGAGEIGIMQTLLANGADPVLATNDRTTPLMVASGLSTVVGESRRREGSALEAVTLAVARGGDVNAASAAGETALHAAAFAGEDAVVRFLVGHGAIIDATNRLGKTPLDYAEGGAKTGAVVIINKSTADLLRQLLADRR